MAHFQIFEEAAYIEEKALSLSAGRFGTECCVVAETVEQAVEAAHEMPYQ